MELASSTAFDKPRERMLSRCCYYESEGKVEFRERGGVHRVHMPRVLPNRGGEKNRWVNQMIRKQMVASQNRWWYNRCGGGQRGRRHVGNAGSNKGKGQDGGCSCRQHFCQAFSFHRRCVDKADSRAELKSVPGTAELYVNYLIYEDIARSDAALDEGADDASSSDGSCKELEDDELHPTAREPGSAPSAAGSESGMQEWTFIDAQETISVE